MKQARLLICLLISAVMGLVQGQTLRSLADTRGIHIGAAVTFPSSPAVYDTTLAHEFNGIVCENAMKFTNIMTGSTTFNYTSADAIVNFGISHGMYVRGHNFIWHLQNPTWFMNLNVSRDSAFKIMKYYITTEMTHYKGKINEWDIVNEAVAKDSSGMRLGKGYSDTTQNNKWAALTDAANHDFDYIDSAYTYARRADSSVLLFYNDYNCEGLGKKANMVYNLVSHLKSLNLIDGIGLQCHFHLLADTGANGAWNPVEMASNLQRLAALGLRISFTEVDIRIPNVHNPMTAADSANVTEQRNEYKTLVGLFLGQPNCKSFFTWGVNDTQSWVPQYFKGYGSGLLFSNAKGADGEYVAKAGYYGVQEELLTFSNVIPARNGSVRMTPMHAGGNRSYDLLGRTLGLYSHYPPGFVIKPGVRQERQVRLR